MVVRLQEGLNELVRVVNGNNRAYSSAVQHLELRINAVADVIELVSSGGVVVRAEDKIDWGFYLSGALQKMREELARLKEEQPPALVAPDLGDESETDDLVEFGGTNA